MESSGSYEAVAEYMAQEMIAVAAGRRVRDGQVVFLPFGLPCLAAILAKGTHALRAVLLCKSGILDGAPAGSRVPAAASGATLSAGKGSQAAASFLTRSDRRLASAFARSY